VDHIVFLSKISFINLFLNGF